MVKIGFRATRTLPREKVLANPRIDNFPVIKPTVGWVEVNIIVVEGVLNGDAEAEEELRSQALEGRIPPGQYDLIRFYGGGPAPKFGKRRKKENEGMPTIRRDFIV